MITYSQLGNYGRLGNQLFQYAMVRSVSLETGYQLKIPPLENIVCQNQRCQLTEFNIQCDYLEPDDYYRIGPRFVEPDHREFYPQVFQVRDNTDFAGYFQNYQYFAKYQEQILEDLRFNKELQQFAEDYVQNCKKNNEEIVSVHFRRGDNVDGTFGRHGGMVPNYYGADGGFDQDSIFGTYLNSALPQFQGNVKFLVFSGGSQGGMNHNQGDIDWCKEQIQHDRFIFCEGNNDMQDFAIMAHCDHNILSHTTSFGYWAAILNRNPDKIVIAPKSYTLPDDGRTLRGFYPPTWRTA